MKTLSRRSIAFASLLVGLLLTLASGPAFAAGFDDSPSIATYSYDYDLADAHMLLIEGSRNKDGSCTFTGPLLELKPDEFAVEARRTVTDFSSCTQHFEIGVPPADKIDQTPPPGGGHFSESFSVAAKTTSGRPTMVQATSGSTVAYYEVLWRDFAFLTTSRTRSYLSWNWNGTCVTSSSAWGDYYWKWASGWSLISSSGYKTEYCQYHQSMVDYANYRNTFFCNPTIVNTYVDDVRTRGFYNGALTGQKLSTSTVETPNDPNCWNLSYVEQLVRVSG